MKWSVEQLRNIGVEIQNRADKLLGDKLLGGGDYYACLGLAAIKAVESVLGALPAVRKADKEAADGK